METCPSCGMISFVLNGPAGPHQVGGCICKYLPKKTGGVKNDQDKPHMNLLLQEVPNALVEVSKALRMGEEKYGRGNWRIVESKEDRYLAALMRHLVAIHQGEKNDPESGLSHLAHVAVNALFLLDSEKHQ